MPGRLSARPWLGIHSSQISKLEMRVNANARLILIATPTGSFRATYAPNSVQLAVQSEWFGSTVGPTELGRLRVDAWRLANDTAHELGWF